MTTLTDRDCARGIISIHMPHTWHDFPYEDFRYLLLISIHMPHTWHDEADRLTRTIAQISIHMPHTWHDSIQLFHTQPLSNFNPHATYVA